MLNAAQLRGATSPGHTLISACPGSGKTRVLAHRAEHVLAGAPGTRLGAATFTQDAANELESRIASRVADCAGRVVAGTFHSLALAQLQASGRRIKLASDAEARALLRRAWSAAGAPESFDAAQRLVERCKATLGSAGAGAGRLFDVYLKYQEMLRQRGLSDFADLMLEAVSGMRNGAVKPLDVRFLLVDEFQDADEVQVAWTLAHVGAGVEVTVVGDDDQSIYGWRNALGQRGMQFFLDATRATRVDFGLSYRCAPEIIVPAQRLIELNEHRLGKTLTTANTRSGTVGLVEAENRRHEASCATLRIAAAPSEWAVLARSNRILDAMEIALAAAGIPHHRVGGTSFWETPAAAYLVRALQGLVADDFAGLDGLLQASRMPHEQLDELARALSRHGAGSLERFPGVIRKLGLDQTWIGEFAELSQQWRELARRGRDALVINGVADWIDAHIDKRTRRIDAMVAAEALQRFDGTLSARLARIAFASGKKQDREGTALMTLHASKGLEFERVWILSVQHGLLPHKDGELEEERRLLYVGMTRAKSELVLSYAKSDGRGAALAPSQFIGEAGLCVEQPILGETWRFGPVLA